MSYQKQNHLEPKEILSQVEYSYTVNPSDDYQYWGLPMDDRIKKSKTHMNYVLRRWPNMRCTLHMDISRNGRIHWHGTIKFLHENHIKQYFFETIHELQKEHNIDMDGLKDPKVWEEYCKKLKWLDITVRTETSSRGLAQVMEKAAPCLHKPIDEY